MPALVAAVVLVVVLGIIAVAGRDDGTDPVGAGGGAGASGSAGQRRPRRQGGIGRRSSATRAPRRAATPTPRPTTRMTRFTAVRAGADDRSVDVTFYGGVDTCYAYVVRADETAQQVALSLSEERKGDGPASTWPRSTSGRCRWTARSATAGSSTPPPATSCSTRG